MGGEKTVGAAPPIHQRGSPPRGRGKVANANQASVPHGITPAWAGKRPAGPCGRRRSWDHPRVGGEKAELTAAVISAMGSPPRRRGKAGENHLVAQLPGITPAQAGKSRLRKMYRPAFTGSPPRGRGKEHRQGREGRSRRITPAWAGKSLASQPWSPPLWMMVIRPRP